MCDAFVSGGDGLPSASQLGVPRTLRAEVEALGRPALVRELDLVLDLLDSPLACLALSGRAARFRDLSLAEREAFLRRLAASPIPAKRTAFQVLKRLTLYYAYALEGSPYAARAGYVAPVPDPPAEPAPLRARVPRAGETIEADVCVVGSGAGGAVAAAVLAAAGMRVVVLERARWRAEPDLEPRELAGAARLYLDRAIAATEDKALVVFAGSAVGGGTVVNWNTSLRLRPDVRGEWRAAGIGDDLDAHYGAVEARLDVDVDESGRNGPNAALERGLRSLGWECATIPRNVKGCGDCGHCHLGCRRGAKQSTMRTYLADACRDGAELLHACEARRILARDGRVAGVVARVDGGEVVVRAPRAALAGGAILSPALLLRSGIATDRAGRSLCLHPTVAVAGSYDEPVFPWRGVPQSVVGFVPGGAEVWLECAPALPGILAASLPWWGSADHLARMALAAHVAPFIALVRDGEGGRVDVNAAGEARMRYWPGPRERALLARGMVEGARAHLAAGARRVATLHTPPLEVERGAPIAAFAREVERRGVVPNRVAVFSAHQMSTCRIGTSPRHSVADPEGQVWGVRGLFVTDASAFPSAAGTNPMLTVMALARRTAGRMR